jgi:arylsulfatase A-like enzyme
MQGRSIVPILRGENPATWRQSMYYRYYHDPGHHNTRAHYGVRTSTHKLIYFWKKDAWELFDLTKDPTEQNNIYEKTESAPIVATLKAELAKLRRELKDADQFANELPKDGVDGGVLKWQPGQGPNGPTN